MRHLASKFGMLTAAAMTLTTFAAPAVAQQKFITIGTGGVTGVYTRSAVRFAG